MRVGEKAVDLIYQWNMLDNLSVTATSMQAIEIYDVENKLDPPPHLPPSEDQITVKNLNWRKKMQVNKEAIKMTTKLVKLNISKNSVMLKKIKLKGCSFHEQFQLALKKCQ